MIVLGIETSCDETSIAVVDNKKVLASPVISQDEVHAKYGGVVPELASRRHMETIAPLFRKALSGAKVTKNNIDGIAVTHAPGLLGSLLIGLQFAKGVALAWKKPIIGVNHLEGHLNAVCLTDDPPYPHLNLVVSGGHTSLYIVEGFGKYKRIAETIDDAAGEAFDKVAKLLDLGYPGGPKISKIAENGNPKAFLFTQPNIKDREFAFSFSGIKTAVMHTVRKQGKLDDQLKADLAASFQSAAVKFLIKPIMKAANKYNINTVTLGGGVAANKLLRETLTTEANKKHMKVFIPPMEYCTDNAAMIAYVGGKKLELGEVSDLSLNAVANMEIG